MAGVWPGGGLFAIPALKIGDDVWVHTTFGFTNPDMPTGVALEKTGFDADEQGRRRVRTRIVKHEPAAKTDGAAGYGYSIMLATRSKDRPLNFLQWAVNAEIVNDVGRLGRVARHDGLTVDDLAVGPGLAVDVLIDKAEPPLPIGAMLPTGSMTVPAATVITHDEMQWTFDHGRPALRATLREAGVGQISALDRRSVSASRVPSCDRAAAPYPPHPQRYAEGKLTSAKRSR